MLGYFFAPGTKAALQAISQKLDALTNLVNLALQKGNTMALDLTQITANVAQLITVDASVEELLTSLSAKVAALSSASTDPATQAAIDALSSEIATQATNLGAAVVANTPAAPAPAAAAPAAPAA